MPVMAQSNQSKRLVRIAVLDCDYTAPKVAETWGPSYGNIFAHRLKAAGKSVCPTRLLDFSFYDILKNEIPNADAEFDAIIITGSTKAVYDPDAWIPNLKSFIQETYHHRPQVRMFGACFGHQIISEALLEQFGVIVEKDSNGYEVGVQTISLNPVFSAHFRHVLDVDDENKLRMQFAHGDHVRLDLPWPESWMSIGSTSHCRIQGVFQPGRILTFQGHFEFDQDISTHSMKYFYTTERGFTTENLDSALRQAQQPDDADKAAKLLFAFLAEG